MYLRLTLNMRTQPGGTIMRDPTQVAHLHARQLEWAAPHGMERFASHAVDADVGGDVVRLGLTVDLGGRHGGREVAGFGEFGAFEGRWGMG